MSDKATAMEEQIEKWFEADEENYLEFHLIPESNRLHHAGKMCGLIYLAQMSKPPDECNWSMSAAHDTLYLPGLDELREVTEEDCIYLNRCGLMWDSEYSCFAMFT